MAHDVIVVGAGITGLAAAYELHRRGLRPLVFEGGSRAGGLIRTERADGFTIEAGPDSVLTSKPAALDLIRDVGLDGAVQQVRTPGAFVLRGRRLYALPSPSMLGLPVTWRGLFAYDLLPWRARLRLAHGVLVPTRRRSADDESVADFFRREFGPDTVDLIAQPLLGGIHAGDIEQLSMASLFPRLLEIQGTSGVMRAPRTATPRAPFVSLRGGMGTLVDALESRLPPGTIRYDSRVDAIETTARGFDVTAAGVRHHVEGPLVFAAPAHMAARLFGSADAAAAALCAEVPYASTASVSLAWRRAEVPHPLDGSGFVVARTHTDVRITACTWTSSKWAERAPDGAALLRVFLGGSHDPHAVSLSDDELAGIARRDLGAVLGIRAEPTLTRVYRWPGAGAQHTVNHLARVAEIERRLTPRRIFVAGSGFRSVGIPDCVADARRIAGEAAEVARQT